LYNEVWVEPMTTGVAYYVGEYLESLVGPRLYTRNMSEPVDIIVTRDRWQIVGMLAPGGVIG
jgi:hypothetical protein